MAAHETRVQIVGRLREHARELRRALADLPADDASNPHIAKERKSLAAKLRHVENRIFSLTQASFHFGG
jgi:hypothetical protein